ncbi:hypothetical protein ADJ73_00815 [Arsenicicoccus sp. oral taxon 190]|nr:hypothetical protein ADJ73_00815 [Arsenicicoccus sp. oral taxon 190]
MGASALVVVLLWPGGCAPSQGCTSIGAANGVRVRAPGAGLRPGTSVEVCVRGRCVPGAARGEDEWFAEMDSLSSTEAVEVEVKVAGVTAVRTP